MTRRGAFHACLVAAVVASSAAVSVARAPTDFGFTATGGPLVVVGPRGMDATDPATCARCHVDVAREWAGSMHARSFVDPIFQAELADSRDTHACVACHGPLDVSGGRGREASIGVACAACHVRDGAILARVRPRPSASPHPVRRVDDFGSAAYCGGCHDFAFPVQSPGPGVPYEPGSPQQATLTEWATTEHAREGRDCVGCHMNEVTRAPGRVGRSHAVRSLEDPAFVATALDVRASASATGDRIEVAVELRVRGAGHAVPSGDIFRELHVRAENDCGADREILMRRFAEASTAQGWVLRDTFDDRVFPGETRRVVLHLPRCEGTTRYEVRELRLGEEAAERRRIATNDYVIPLARGIVDPPGSQP